MSRYSEELQTKVREALTVRLQNMAGLSLDGCDVEWLAGELSRGVAAAIDKADTEAWLSIGERGPDYDAHLDLILDALKDT